MLQLLVLAAASRLPVRIYQKADSSKAPAPAPGQLAVRRNPPDARSQRSATARSCR